MSSYLQPTDIRALLDKLRNAKSAIETYVLSQEMRRMSLTMEAFASRKFSESASTEIIRAFEAGRTTAALKRLIEIRSGGESDQSSSKLKVENIDIEDKKQPFYCVYSNFCSAIVNATSSTNVCKELLRENAIELILQELNCSAFRKYKRGSPSESQTAEIISTQLDIISNICNEDALQSELRRVLQTNVSFEILKFYCSKRSVPICFYNCFSSTLHFHLI